MIFKKLDSTEDYQSILSLWNSESSSNFYIRNDLFVSQIINSNNLDSHKSILVYVEDKLIGFIVVKTAWNHAVSKLQKTAWISLMLVSKTYRNKGIGTRLLNATITALKKDGYNTLFVGKDIQNLFCGVPEVFDSYEFFTKKGFVINGESYDLHKNVKTSSKIELKRKLDYQVSIAEKTDFKQIRLFFQNTFPDRWLFEIDEYVRLGGTGREFVIIKKDNKVIAFCRINDKDAIQNMHNRNWDNPFQNLIGIGPLGVDDNYRGNYLGYDVTAYAINEAIRREASDIIIDWTSKVDFYRKFGCTPYMKYWSLSIDLRG